MQFFLTSLLLASSAVAAPAKPESCTSKSQRPHWTVEKFDFHSSKIFTTPAHQNSWGYVNFTLENTALGYKPVCSSASSRLEDFYYGDQVYECKNPKGAKGAGPTSYTFNVVDGELKINQTWSCPEGSRFTAEGGQKYKLDCKTKSYQNPNWTEGEIYSSETTTCKRFTKPMPITEMSAVA